MHIHTRTHNINNKNNMNWLAEHRSIQSVLVHIHTYIDMYIHTYLHMDIYISTHGYIHTYIYT